MNAIMRLRMRVDYVCDYDCVHVCVYVFGCVVVDVFVRQLYCLFDVYVCVSS